MNSVSNAIEVYERLRKNKYEISIENGTSFTISFPKASFHHLAGFHYLTDISQYSKPNYGMERFFSDLQKNRLSTDKIIESELYPDIRERIESFPVIEEIMAPGDHKLIIDFDNTKTSSKIVAKYYLFKRTGSTIEGNITYYNLFLGYDCSKNIYYPATFLVEHSTMYFSGQNVLNCTIKIK